MVNTAASGVTTVANTGKKGIFTARKGVTTVAQTAGKGVTTVASSAGKGVTSVAQTAGNGVTTVVSTAASGATGVGKTLSRATTGQSSSTPKIRVTEKSNEKDVFCSDLYAVDYVLDEIKKVKENTQLTTISFEDIATRGNQDIFKAAINLITETATRPDSANNPAPITNKYERDWESITFLECISSAEDYQIYVDEKKEFQALLRKMLKKKNIVAMPIKFQTKIEIHSFMNMKDAMELLDVIGKDPTILAVKFPHLSKERKKIPAQVVNHFDHTTLEFKETASPIEINIRYGGKQTTDQSKAATRIIKVCAQRLKKIAEQLDSGYLPPLSTGDESQQSFSEMDASFRMAESSLKSL